MRDSPPILIYVFDEDDFSSDDLIGLCVIPLQESVINHSSASTPVWQPLSLGKSDCGELLVSFNMYKKEDIRLEYTITPKTIEAVVEINCLGLRDLIPALGWLPINKAFVKFDMNSLQIPGENKIVRNIQTQPSEPGHNPNINSIIKFDCKMPINKLFCPTLTCTVYDNLFKGLSQPLIGSFAIHIGEIYHKNRKKTKRHPLETDTKIDSENTSIRLRKPSLIEANQGGFVLMPEFEEQKNGKPKEINKPSHEYMQLGYNRKSDDKLMHYRYVCNQELEKTEYIDESPFEKFDITRGQDKGLEDNWMLMLSSNKDKEGNRSTKKLAGIFKGIIRVTRKSKEEERDARKQVITQKAASITNQLNKTGKIAYTELASAVLMRKKDEEEKIDDESDEENYVQFESVRKMLLVKTQVIVRVYIVEALNLAQKDYKSNSDPYIRIKLQDQIIDDSKNYQTDEPNPKIYKVWDLKTTLPGASRLKIQVWDKDMIIKDDKIGSTIIDLEDRYFSSKWKSLSEKPIETRNLYHPSTRIIQGQVRL